MKTAKTVFLEAVFVAVAGAALAFAANALSPRGISLSRNYFPVAAAAPAATSNPSDLTTNALDAVAVRLASKGLRLARTDEVQRLFHDPKYLQQSILFIDARDDQHYQAGHIPGAMHLDYYHPEKNLAAVLAACQTAEQIVIYCNGGDCEDSEFTALLLKDAGVALDKLLVYGAGITDWVATGNAVETGERHSGVLKKNHD